MSDRYDVIIAGGGLAGLSLAILLAKKKYRVAVFEKEQYPFNKVCGEYVAMESWDFLERLGLKLNEWKLPRIQRLRVSSQNGNYFTGYLNPGGFGVSRYLLDASLASACREHGVEVFERTRVSQIDFEEESFRVTTQRKTFESTVVIGSFGKRSNLDRQWNRTFLSEEKNNWVGVKYHLQRLKNDATIQLHGFEDGYCGINPIEENKSCLCYMVKATKLQQCHKNIQELEERILMKNKLLRPVFEDRRFFLFPDPLTISQISFATKEPVLNHILMLGDAAGMVVPLFGNGMSMAFRSAHLAAPLVDDFLQGKIQRKEMEKRYSGEWRKNFSGRMKTGRFLQPLFTSTSIARVTVGLLKAVSPLRQLIVNASHGKSF